MSLLIYRVWKTCLFGAIVFAMLSIAPAIFAVTIENPITAKSFPELITSITKNLIPIAIVFAVAAIVFTGFKFITAAVSGSPQELTNARKTFWWVLIGTAIVVGAYALAYAVVNFAKTLG